MSDARALVLALGLALTAIACGSGRSEPAHVRSGDIEIAVSVAPRELRVGDNQLWIELRDAAGQPVSDAHVEAEVRMPAMGAMSAMGGPASVESLGEGRYRADFALAMVGTWQVALRAHRPSGELAAAEGSLTVGTPGVRLEGAAAAAAAEAPPAPAMGHVHGAPRPAAATPSGGSPGEFHFDPARLRQVGIGSEPVRREDLQATVRAVGRVVVDEKTLHDVTVRVGGFVGAVEADALGEPVEKGQVLFTMYGPDLYAAEREYLEALRSDAAARGTSAPDRARWLVRAAEQRLRLWGIDPADVAAIAQHGVAQEQLPVRAPTAGYVVEKEIVAGSPVAMGQRVYRIAPLDRVWIEAEVYESEIAQVSTGMRAEVTLPYVPGRSVEGTVAYVYPSLQADRRTARVRIELANPGMLLRPAMYADVFLRRPLGARLTVPDTAVLHAGDRDFVFLDLGEGRLRPQRVQTGLQSDGRVEIVSGVEEGQPVVVSGTFLVASESRLRSALESW